MLLVLRTNSSASSGFMACMKRACDLLLNGMDYTDGAIGTSLSIDPTSSSPASSATFPTT